MTRITIVLLGDELMISQIAAQCRKLLPVIAVKILDESTSLQREMALIKVKTLDRNAPGRGHPDGQHLPGQHH